MDVHSSQQEQDGDTQAHGRRTEENEERCRTRLGARFCLRRQMKNYLLCGCHFPISVIKCCVQMSKSLRIESNQLAYDRPGAIGLAASSAARFLRAALDVDGLAIVGTAEAGPIVIVIGNAELAAMVVARIAPFVPGPGTPRV